MKIYLDDEYKCHTENDGTMQEIETDYFDGKSKIYIEGYRFIPNGKTWVNRSGTVFRGEMVAPWKDYSILALAQEAYDEANSIVQIITGEVIADDES